MVDGIMSPWSLMMCPRPSFVSGWPERRLFVGPSLECRLPRQFQPDRDRMELVYLYPASPTFNGYDGFTGQIGEVRIWSSPRTADEVRQDMITSPVGTETGLLADYTFDEGQGLTAHDLTPHHNDGTLAGPNGDLPTWPGGSSSELAIDLGNDGITDNSTSPRQGPNNLQNFPVVITTSGGQLEGGLSGSTPNMTFRIDLFASDSYSTAGAGQAEVYLGSLGVTTDGQGQAVFDIPFTLPAGKPMVTATATDPQGNTSEVSALRTTSLRAPHRQLAGFPVSLCSSRPPRATASPSKTLRPGRSTRPGT